VRGMSCRVWERRLAALIGAALAVLSAGGVAQAAEEIAADAPVPTDPRAFGGHYVMSPYTTNDFGYVWQAPGQSTLSDVVPTVSGRLSRVDVFFANYAGHAGGEPVAQNFFVDFTHVDAEGRPTDVLASAGVPVGSLPSPTGSSVQSTPTAVLFGNGPQVVAGERYALVYRTDGCCVGQQDAQETPSVPDAWIGTIPFGSTTTTWNGRYSVYPTFYQGTIAVRMWVDTTPTAPLDALLDTLLPSTPPSPPAVSVQPSSAPPLCGRPVVLTDVTVRGRQVRLAGVTRAQYAGRPVLITAGGRPVAVATVGLDGTFRTTAARAKGAETLRYQARIADERSAALRATRWLIIDSQAAIAGGVRVRGHLVSRRAARRTLAVTRQLGCSATTTPNAKVLRTDRRGRFGFTLPNPPPDQRIAVYRLRTTSGGRSYTLPLVLRTP
jgi:antitoxin (DNA-binding transcriptional repressor) of toxin-antitoxin stability system